MVTVRTPRRCRSVRCRSDVRAVVGEQRREGALVVGVESAVETVRQSGEPGSGVAAGERVGG